MATLTYSHFGNHGHSYHRAQFPSFLRLQSAAAVSNIVRILRDYSARECQFRRPRRLAAGGRVLAAAGFLF